MRVLIIGSGGREHALAWRISQSRFKPEIISTPGNAGMYQFGSRYNIAAADIPGILNICRNYIKPGLVVIGPEDPLAAGMADALREANFAVFGPSAKAAEIESSKWRAKQIMRAGNVPTANAELFWSIEQAYEYLEKVQYPIVVKANGLALGKGVFICDTKAEAKAAAYNLIVKGDLKGAGLYTLIEDCLVGKEVSVMAICDGKGANGGRFILLPSVQDYKRIGEGDTGSNTGGMGSVSPVAGCDNAFLEKVADTIIAPTLKVMADEGHPFQGCLYAGLMITDEGPKVLEFNCRFGDPETQVAMMLLGEDLLDLLLESSVANLHESRIARTHLGEAAACVVACSGGYPDAYEKGKIISGLDIPDTDNNVVFHAGTELSSNNIITNGGRVFGVTSRGIDLYEALLRCYNRMGQTAFEKIYFRPDIGRNAI